MLPPTHDMISKIMVILMLCWLCVTVQKSTDLVLSVLCRNRMQNLSRLCKKEKKPHRQEKKIQNTIMI